MAVKHKLIKGALILTAAGFISRLMGFFFRIFLSHAFGEENVGLYQLVFPVYALCLSVSTSGIQTALSRTVARKMSLNRPGEARSVLFCALFITVILSAAEILIIQQNAKMIAVHFLGDARCTELLVIISYALPCAAIHSCICGYSYGVQQAGVPAVSQLVEQSMRILSVIFLFFFLKSQGSMPSVSLAVAGVVIGELASALYSARNLSRTGAAAHIPGLHSLRRSAAELIPLSLPLTANRTAVTLLQSIEAASIPACLKLYTHSASEALILYGVLTGMALPCILFPSAVTNSVGTMLMPAVAEKQAAGKHTDIVSLLRRTAGSCFILGLSCCLFFLLFGSFIGRFLFRSETAGSFIMTLAWICPFLYTNSAMLSAINGLGRTTATFLINAVGLLIRIAGVFFVIPDFGIQGYLWGLLVSQLSVTILSVLVLRSEIKSSGGILSLES